MTNEAVREELEDKGIFEPQQIEAALRGYAAATAAALAAAGCKTMEELRQREAENPELGAAANRAFQRELDRLGRELFGVVSH